MLGLLLAMSGISNAQAPYFRKVPFDKEKKSARLLNLYQDKKGLIWLGTSVGVCRYDGINFKYLEKDSALVSCITEDNAGLLWMGHVNGTIEYCDHLKIKQFNPGKFSINTKITDILFDKQNRMWFSTYGQGIFCYTKDSLCHIDAAQGLADDAVYSMVLADDDNIWLATDMGISICNFTGSKKIIENINSANGLPDNLVRKLKKDAAGNIWIALQDKGVCYAEKKSHRIIVPPVVSNWKYGQVNDVLPMKNEVWIGTEENGIIEIHPGLDVVNKMIPVKNKSIGTVHQLLLDKNEQVWMIADNVLSISNSNRFQTIEIPFEWQDAIKAITTDSSGKIWFANRKGIFIKADNNSPIQQFNKIHSIDYSAIISLFADYKNNIWIGTYNHGLYHYITASGKLEHFTKNEGLVNDNIFSIAGKRQEIWLGTLGGATKIDISSDKPVFKNFTKQNGLSNNYVYHISIDSRQNKWFATDGSGICKLSDSGFKNFDHIGSLEKNIVYTMAEDVYGNMWFSGLNSGLFRFDGKDFKHYTFKDGMDDNEILNIVADDKGNLVLTHPDGIELFNIKKELFTFYGAETGFDNLKPQLNASCVAADKSILIGGTDKIVKYFPANLNQEQLPELVMNDVQIFFKSIGNDTTKTFAYNKNHFTFDYAGLWYINPDAVSYTYQLEGYNKDWIVTKDHVITFPQLTPGHYVFRVKTSINDNFKYAPVLTYSFTITRPFWKTLWFISLAVLALLVVLFYLVRLRIRMINFNQEKKNQQLLGQLEVLKNQLNPHFLFNSFNTLMNIIDKDAPLAIEYTEKLSDFYREILLMQDRKFVTVREEILLLQNYIYLQQKRFGKNLHVVFNVTQKHLGAGIPPLTLQLLAENAFKHNAIDNNNPLTIRIESAQSFILISNNINPQQAPVRSAGIGLKNIQRRVLLLTGEEVKVVKDENEFNVIVPLKFY